jgi:hypothetical protein
LVVAIRQSLSTGDPEPLRQEEQKQPGGDTLWQIEAEASKTGEPMGHLERK